MLKRRPNLTRCTHEMSAHGREHSKESTQYNDTISQSQISSSDSAMASQSARGDPLRLNPQRSEEALSDRTICGTERSFERQTPAPDAAEDGTPQPLKRSRSAPAVAFNESRKPIEAPRMAPQDPVRTEFPKLHKLSMLATSTFALACVTVPCCVAFIGFLWSNPDGTQNDGTWLKIVLNGWILKSVTISTMVLRVAVSAQAG